MAPSHLSIWTQCLQDLQRLPALINDPGEQLITSTRIASKVTQWRALPAAPASVWRQLVLEVKVGHTMVPTRVALVRNLICAFRCQQPEWLYTRTTVLVVIAGTKSTPTCVAATTAMMGQR